MSNSLSETRRQRLFFSSEILRFKSEHDASKQMAREHDEAVVLKKPESIMVNQYSTSGESDEGFSFNTRNDDSIPAVRDKNLQFRYYTEAI